MAKRKQKTKHAARVQWTAVNDRIQWNIANGKFRLRMLSPGDEWFEIADVSPADVLRLQKVLQLVRKFKLGGYFLTFCGQYDSVNIGCQRVYSNRLADLCNAIRAAGLASGKGKRAA